MTGEFDTVDLSQIIEIWESYTGWYWFITEIVDEELAFGLVRGHEIEWGYISRRELAELADEGKIWRVPKCNWLLCPCVVDAKDGGGSPSSQSQMPPSGPVRSRDNVQLKGGVSCPRGSIFTL